MAASDSDPLSAAGLAAALEAGADASGTGGKPVSVGNLKALVDGGKIGAVDVLFKSDTPVRTANLTNPIDDYDLVVMVSSHGSGLFFLWGGSPALWQYSQDHTSWYMSATDVNSSRTGGTGQRSNANSSARGSGKTMTYNVSDSSKLFGIVLVIGIKTVGGGFS